MAHAAVEHPVTTPSGTRSMDRWGRIGGTAGVAFVVLTMAGGFVQGDVPVYSEGPAVIKEWFAANSDRYLVGSFLIVVGALCFLVFLAVLVNMLVRADDTHAPWPWMVLAGGVLVVVPPLVSTGFDPRLALLEGDVSDEVARSLSAGDYMTLLLMYPFAGAMALATSLAIARSDVLWRRLAWFGPFIALGGLVSMAAPLEHDAEGVLTWVGYLTLFAFLA